MSARDDLVQVLEEAATADVALKGRAALLSALADAVIDEWLPTLAADSNLLVAVWDRTEKRTTTEVWQVLSALAEVLRGDA